MLAQIGWSTSWLTPLTGQLNQGLELDQLQVNQLKMAEQ
jgi:hypothetical protein